MPVTTFKNAEPRRMMQGLFGALALSGGVVLAISGVNAALQLARLKPPESVVFTPISIGRSIAALQRVLPADRKAQEERFQTKTHEEEKQSLAEDMEVGVAGSLVLGPLGAALLGIRPSLLRR